MTDSAGIVDFIRARCRDDEQIATALRDALVEAGGATWQIVCDQPGIADLLSVQSTEFDHARTLREVAAHRALLDAYDASQTRWLSTDAWIVLRDLLPHVAAIWSDHPSWRSEWNVTE